LKNDVFYGQNIKEKISKDNTLYSDDAEPVNVIGIIRRNTKKVKLFLSRPENFEISLKRFFSFFQLGFVEY
jgi:hypothetical protein